MDKLYTATQNYDSLVGVLEDLFESLPKDYIVRILKDLLQEEYVARENGEALRLHHIKKLRDIALDNSE